MIHDYQKGMCDMTVEAEGEERDQLIFFGFNKQLREEGRKKERKEDDHFSKDGKTGKER